MFKSFAIISLVTTAALAQSSSVVPSGISQGCSTFLNNLNTDKGLTTCLSALAAATADYRPGSDATKSPSTAKIGSTLGNLCSSSVTTNCPDGLIRGNITNFYSACSAELTSNPNTDVISIYDILYTISPLKTAACSKDDSGNYCVTQAKLPASGQTAAEVQQVLAGPSLAPNTTAFRTYNIPFFFLQSSLPSSELCNVCTRNIMTAYMNFEAKVPYAPGLGKSILLANQPELYQGIQSTCGSTFLSGAGVQAAGGLSGGTLSSGAVQNIVGAGQSFIAVGMGAIALIASSVF
ncbi:hypothetical protein D9615_007942 [Tricholomella constricta]|uniref:DUF7729 domain-containing protein n=1 Tax=Tricholomella constricta TaxID=117010 RepID=A0A8H5H2D8_9AGAR|nr:hypothetical protein D9615_007942 [Tricholomella constricta]